MAVMPSASVTVHVFVVPTADVHRIHPGGSQPVPGAQHLHSRADPGVQGQEDRGAPPTHLCHRGQLLPQHEEVPAGPVYHHQVSAHATHGFHQIQHCMPCVYC